VALLFNRFLHGALDQIRTIESAIPPQLLVLYRNATRRHCYDMSGVLARERNGAMVHALAWLRMLAHLCCRTPERRCSQPPVLHHVHRPFANIWSARSMARCDAVPSMHVRW
jgi:hypothetical protein